MFKESNALLARLSDEQRNALQGRDLVLKQGTRLHDAGSRSEFVYFPRSCVVSEAIVMDDGRLAGTAITGREGAIGSSADFSPGAEPPINRTRADVLIGGAAFRVPFARIATLLQMPGAFATGAANYQRSLLHEAHQTTACNVLHSLDQRVSRFLLTVDQRGGGQSIPVTQEALALILGAHRASLNKVVQKLQACGAIAVLRRAHIEIGDRSVLTAQSCGCPA